ncbi:holo-ACP synthase [Treponema sp. Marseille-Q3903]|uniref:holo-ACP synthase n=1 Tax=Treponema sp. Marseille-Q3903 TaxID=2766703 RepID=UPI001652120C|nr:holo-ACP synthase [Treponema sp. Marseille-Q3903]MBC6713798.1 holo-ACP synthase [Treponema sp. Marseille-Q3903]
MIYGIGSDIAEVKRFEKWVKNPQMIDRFFNEREVSKGKNIFAMCQHLAVRFAAKEAFSKALGTGLSGFELKDVYITKDENGKPFLNFQKSAINLLKERCGECRVHVSLSHEKEYALAFVVIEKGE